MSVKRIKNLVKQLNEYRHAYYNQDAPLVSDAEYDRLFDELKELEEQTGFILSNSPTQTVGYYPVSELAKVTHPIPLLSLEKTKLISELLDFMKGQEVLFMLKLDGLTTKLIYEDGRLIQASTRGDGEVGEDITHNIPAFLNVPLTIPHKERLVITGESFIPTNDFERLKDTLRDGNGKPYKNGRNFASGSVRSLDPKNCIGRCVRFLPFNVLEGMEDVPFPDSRACKLEGLTHLGFGYCPFFSISGTGLSKEYAEKFIQELVSTAANLHLPIDGIVMIFDSLSYSKSCGKTGHHYKDGLAYKFEDDTYETFLREIEWTPTRFGEIAPVGIFDTVEIDGCDVSRASLHNLTFIKNLELVPGCRILVSKRNMIIPHIEDNLDRGRYTDITPPVCPCCGSKTRTYSRKTSDGRTVETLHCDNPQCDSQITRRFVHFASKKAMNIEGLSEATLEKFLNLGYLHSFQDIYHLEEHREDIVALDGYGEKSFDRLWESINASRRTSFVRYLVSMDIPMIGRTKSRILDTVFSGNLTAFEQAAVGDYDFTQLEDFGEILNHNIHSWFADEANLDLWKNLQNEFTFEQRKEETIMTKENKFTGWTDVELSEQGINEAKEAGKVLKEQGFHFDIAFTSVLKRAEDTLDYILKEMGEENIEIKRSWRLNERHYGALQGLNKDETREKYGAEQVLLWRRSTNVRPPELEESDPRYPGNDPKYKELTKDELPKTENLVDTIKRVVEYWDTDIKPELENGKKVIIAAHGNSLRGLIKYLDGMSDEDVIKLELQTGNPICYELDDNLKPIRHYYLKK